MREYRKQAQDGAAKRLKDIQSGEPHTKVDSSSWSPPEMLEADKQNGMRPVSPRQYKSGGKVHGAHSKKRADRKARKEGGRAMSVDGYINRDSKMANDERKGVKKIGGMKRGGKIKREHHADGDAVGDLIRQDQIEQGMKGRGLPIRVPMPMPRPADKANIVKRNAPIITEKRGGKVRAHHAKGGAAHPDEAEDKALIKKMIKSSAMKRDEHCWGGEAKSKKAEGGSTKWIQGAIKHPGSLHKALHVPAGEKIPAKKLEKAAHSDNPKLAKKANLAKTLKRMHHADGGEAGRGLYVRQGYPHEVPGVDGGRVAKKRGGSLGKGKTNVNIMIHPHGAQGGMPPMMPPMGGPILPPPPPHPQMPPMPPQGMPMPPQGGMPPMPGAFKKGGRVAKAFGGNFSSGPQPMGGSMAAPPRGNPFAGGMGGGQVVGGPTPINTQYVGGPTPIGGGMQFGGGHPMMPEGMGGMNGGRPAMDQIPSGFMGGPNPINGGMAAPPRGNPFAGGGNFVGGPTPIGGGIDAGRPRLPPGGGVPFGGPTPMRDVMPPMGAARPGMPPIGRKSGGKVEHVIDHAAGGGLGRLEKIKAYGLD